MRASLCLTCSGQLVFFADLVPTSSTALATRDFRIPGDILRLTSLTANVGITPVPQKLARKTLVLNTCCLTSTPCCDDCQLSKMQAAVEHKHDARQLNQPSPSLFLVRVDVNILTCSNRDMASNSNCREVLEQMATWARDVKPTVATLAS